MVVAVLEIWGKNVKPWASWIHDGKLWKIMGKSWKLLLFPKLFMGTIHKNDSWPICAETAGNSTIMVISTSCFKPMFELVT